MSHTEQMREALRKVRPYLEDGANHGDDAVELLKLVDAAMSAQAGEAQQPSEDVRELSKWLNEETSAPINRQALARVLAVAQQPSGGEVVVRRWRNSVGDIVTNWLDFKASQQASIEQQVAEAGGTIEYAYSATPKPELMPLPDQPRKDNQ